MTTEATHPKPKRRYDPAPILLAVIVTIGYFLTLNFLLTNPIPKESELIVGEMIGALTTVWIGFMFHFIGTTVNSARKTELIAKAGPVETP